MRTVTCYSYKGGTGRTLLVANLAVFAAQLGQRVVVIDFDLEAPGIAYKVPGIDPEHHNPGLVGWLTAALSSGEAPANLSDYLLDAPLDATYVEGGWLKVMPAGRAPSANYFQDLRRLQLEQRLDDGSAIDALIELQAQFDEVHGTDLLLIDARTGITPTNSVTTHVLADEVVALTLATDEQLAGTRSVLRSLQPLTSIRTGEDLLVHTVVSRVAAKPPDASLFTHTDGEREMLDEVRRFLTEPATPLKQTVEIDRLFLLHHEPRFHNGEHLCLARIGGWNRSATHVDYYRIASSVLGEMVTEPARRLIAAARDETAADRL